MTKKKTKKEKPHPDAVKLARYKKQADFFRKEYNKLVSKKADADILIRRMKEVLPTVEPVELWKELPQKHRQSEEEMILPFSDSQIGTKSLGLEIGMVKEKAYGLLGDYNINVFRYRLQLWLKSVVKILRLHRKTTPVNKLNLWFLGDVLENEVIYRGQGAYLETGLMQQFFASIYEVARAIAVLSGKFRGIEIRGVAGNHGRSQTKRTTKLWVNWEFLWYRYLELICRELTNVKFDLTMSWFDLPEVMGHRFLISHGEDVIRYLGFPWYGEKRKRDGYQQLLVAVGTPFDYVISGHHHQITNQQEPFGEWFCNGNWVGYTMFGIKRMYQTAPPKQWLLFCHKKRGIAARYMIDLLEDDNKLWRKVERTSYDIHIPFTNEEIAAGLEKARRIRI